MNKYLLLEDACAPDAQAYFIQQMYDKFGLKYDDFKKYGKVTTPDPLTIECHYNEYVLEYNGDDPFYKLRRENKND